MAGEKIIEADDRLVREQQSLQQVGANKARSSGQQPGLARGAQIFSQLFSGVHNDSVCISFTGMENEAGVKISDPFTDDFFHALTVFPTQRFGSYSRDFPRR